jgi:gamma-glutamyl-gamma-aminobutyrate hydrolase PuuD
LGSADGLSNYTYIAASYVKFIEMSGAQVVPIFAYTKNRTYFDALLPKLNGVLFPGGGEAISIGNIWTSNADYILKYAISENKKGNPFPVWGTCLGWELLAYLTSGYDSKVLSSVRGESAVRNRIAIKSPSYLFDDLSTTLKSNLQNGDGLLYFNHIKAVSTTYY